MPTYPFEVSPDEVLREPERYVDAVFACLESEFLVMPKGPGFVDYPIFEKGYEELKAATSGFAHFDPERVSTAVFAEPMALIVLRSMLGFTPPEWGYVTTQHTGVAVTQSFARSIDRRIRMEPQAALGERETSRTRIQAMIQTACHLLNQGAPDVGEDKVHRLDKADTRHGTSSIRHLAQLGVPYAMLLYERFLGRPFAGHRDSVSELIGNSLEAAIEDVLSKAGISFRKTKRAERIPGFDQAPDFIVPSEFNPQVVIEAKITEDDGTARDKVTRIQHLAALSMAGRSPENPRFEVIACIGGRGFGIRREDMIKLIRATRGKVFTSKTLNQLVACTSLSQFASQ